MAQLIACAMRASFLLVENIRTLLIARGIDDKALALWCGHKPAWLSKILSGERGIKLADLDKIADFFGLSVAELFSRGISTMTERRRVQRRSAQDRRSGVERRQGPRQTGELHPELARMRHRPHNENGAILGDIIEQLNRKKKDA